MIDYGIRRKLRRSLGSRSSRRIGTKSLKLRQQGIRGIKPRVRLAKVIRETRREDEI